MNEAEKQIREALANVPLDDAFRPEHRDQVRELALQAFDEAAELPPATITLTSGSEFARPRLPRRSAVRWALAGLAAASVCAAVLAWSGRSAEEVVQDNAVTHADQQFLAALNVLSQYDQDYVAATFDSSVQMCLAERSRELDSAGL